jgi:uncharacterized protein
MFTKLSDTKMAVIFTVLVLFMALVVALLIRMLGPGVFIVWSLTPTVATLIMLLAVTREGHSKAGWKSLGLHRLGLNVWWIAFGVTFLLSLISSIIVWATPFASFVVPKAGVVSVLLNFLITIVVLMLTNALGEEIGMRGYLLPKLLSLGRTRALVGVGLVHAAWHIPLIFLTPLYHTAGNKLIVLPLFVGTIVAASFVFGYLRIYTGSVWPATIAHAVHNAAWNTLAMFTVASSPVIVNEYLAGDNGLLILVTTTLAAIGLGYFFRRGLNKNPQPGVVGGEVASAAN